jgi:hypothetical protein
MNLPKWGHELRKLEPPGPTSSYIVLVAVYYLLLFLLPASKTAMRTYHLTPMSYHVLLVVVELPLTATWLAAFYGYFKMRQYTTSIADTPEEAGFKRLTKGFQWLAWSLVLPTVLSLITNSIANNHPGFHPTAIILSNYLSLVFPLVAFTLMASGADHLLTRVQWGRRPTQNLKAILLLFAILSGVYCFLTFRHLDLSHPGSTDNPFYLPAWLLLFTIIIPYLYAWFVGLMAAYSLNTLATRSKGLLYRQSLSLIAAGVSLVIASSISSQYLLTAVPRTGHLSINAVLLFVYLFYIVIILGFALVCIGASRLKRIEDI